MTSTHRKTLQAIFAKPVSATLEWRRIEALFSALGAQKDEGRGSSHVTFFLNGARGDFHRPHPQKEAHRYQVRDARAFLERAGVTP